MSLSTNVSELAGRIATEFNTLRSEILTNGVSQIKHEVKLGESIAKGQAVYVSSANGTNMVVSKASNNGENTSSKTLGLLETGGVINDISKLITEGLLAGLDTSSATAGDPVWLGQNGNLIYGLASKPSAPLHLVFIGIVTRVHQNQGEIFVKVQNGFELHELHDVALNSPADADVLTYDAASGLWKNLPVGSTATIVSETAPTTGEEGSFWLDSSTVTLYVRYDSNWVTASPAGPQGPAGADGESGIAPAVAVSSNITLAAKTRYFVDTTAARTLTLPASPVLGDEIQVFDASGSAGTNVITVQNNSNKINGVLDSAALDANGVAAVFVWTGSTYGWRLG